MDPDAGAGRLQPGRSDLNMIGRNLGAEFPTKNNEIGDEILRVEHF